MSGPNKQTINNASTENLISRHPSIASHNLPPTYLLIKEIGTLQGSPRVPKNYQRKQTR